MAIDGPAKQEELAQASPKARHELCASFAISIIQRLQFAVAVFNSSGEIVLVNDAWGSLHRELQPDGGKRAHTANRIAAIWETSPEAEAIQCSLEKVLQRLRPNCTHEFQIKATPTARWFQIQISSMEVPGYFMAILIDTSLQHKAEQDLRESHSLFLRIIEGTGDAVFIYDLEGRFLMHNSACLELFAKDRTKLTGKKIEEVFPPDIARTVRNQNELVLGTGRTLGYEIVVKTSQRERTLLIQKGLYRNHQNQVVGVIAVSRDITDRKLAEEKLQRSERHFRALIEKSSDCVGIVSEKGDVLYISPPAVRMFGFEIKHWLGTNVFFWTHPEDTKRARERFERTLANSKRATSSELRILCKNGEWKWVEVTASNLLKDASVQAIILNVRDISERKQTEQMLQRFRAIIECSVDAIFSINLQGFITSWNPAAARILGYSEEEMIGQDFRRLIPEDLKDDTVELNRAGHRGKAVPDIETIRQAKDGQRIEVALTVSPIYSHGKTIIGTAVILRDIRERRRLEKEVLEISDFEKQRIGQDLHDDLCQHLVGVSMVSSRLQKDLEQYRLKQAEDARQITDMLRNAVDHARLLARGLSPLEFSSDGLKSALEALVHNTTKLFRIPCEFECAGAVQIKNHEVATHLFRITQEALNNAVKHSKGTKVTVRMKRRNEYLEITVYDNGVGFTETGLAESSGLGTHTMSYRARIIGANLSTEQNRDGGLTVTCRFRLSKAECAS